MFGIIHVYSWSLFITDNPSVNATSAKASHLKRVICKMRGSDRRYDMRPFIHYQDRIHLLECFDFLLSLLRMINAKLV